MSAPNMPEEQYKKLTKTQKKVYWTFVVIVFTTIVSLWIYAWFWQ